MSDPATHISLPKLPRSVARALSSTSRCVAHLRTEAATQALSTLLGEPLRIEGPWVESLHAQAPCDPQVVALIFEHRKSTRRIVVELEELLALRLIDAALGEARGLVPTGQRIRDVECGLLAYTATRVAREVNDAWLVRGVVGTQAAVQAAIDTPSMVRATYLFHGSTQSMRARLLVGANADDHSEIATRPTDVPLELRLVAGRSSLRLSELDSLDTGDVLVTDEMTLTPSGSGKLALEPVFGEFPKLWLTRDGNDLRAITPRSIVTSPVQGKISMNETQNALRDLPVEVVVEVARIRLTMRELEQIAEGAILETPIATPPRVQLVVAGQAVALGELVDVEGELGVKVSRLLSRANEAR